MRRLQTTHKLPYRTVRDERREPVRIGRFIYLAILLAIAVFVLDRSLGWTYLLRGNGFVYGPAWTLAMEHTVTVRKLHVREGERVAAGRTLVDVGSNDFERQATELAAELAEVRQALGDVRIKLAQVDAAAASTREEVAFARQAHEQAKAGAKRGLIVTENLSEFAHRRFQAERSLYSLQAEGKTLRAELPALAESVDRVKGHYQSLLDSFNGGTMKAAQSGIVANVDSTPGAVVVKGQPILQIFGEKRYVLAYLDSRSPISQEVGEPVLLNFQGHGWTLGHIGQRTEVASRLPPEFQPQFTATQRDRLVIIEVPEDVLKDVPMLTTVGLYKPVAFDSILAWWDRAGAAANELSTRIAASF